MVDPTPLKLFTSVFEFISAPGAVLAPHFKKVDNCSVTNNASVSSALKRVLQGQEKKAFKLLCSNGVAKVNAETLDVLRKLHPDRKEELQVPQSECPQLQVDPGFVAKRLFGDAGDFNRSKDAYGWAAFLFYSCRGLKSGFFCSLVQFSCFLANSSVGLLFVALWGRVNTFAQAACRRA
jgi:hypothetical protein